MKTINTADELIAAFAERLSYVNLDSKRSLQISVAPDLRKLGIFISALIMGDNVPAKIKRNLVEVERAYFDDDKNVLVFAIDREPFQIPVSREMAQDLFAAYAELYEDERK